MSENLADMRVEVVKRALNQGALAGFDSTVTDYAARLVIAELDSFDEEALKMEFRRGFQLGEINAQLLAVDKLRELAAALNRAEAKYPNPFYVGFGAGILEAIGDQPTNDIDAAGHCCCAGCIGMGPCDLDLGRSDDEDEQYDLPGDEDWPAVAASRTEPTRED